MGKKQKQIIPEQIKSYMPESSVNDLHLHANPDAQNMPYIDGGMNNRDYAQLDEESFWKSAQSTIKWQEGRIEKQIRSTERKINKIAARIEKEKNNIGKEQEKASKEKSKVQELKSKVESLKESRYSLALKVVRTPDGNAQNCLRGCIRRIKNIEDKDRSQIEQQMREISKIEAKVIPKKNERINDFCKKLDALKENVSSLRQTKSTFDSKLVARRV